ncbi:hypothetical protein AB0E83_34160 [Streptomyces sp. NPDC035033]|uniref:hypothetical protein n=1 Tax=Streptomyces sp. NPDC035033 TaxID=3155368 RepID=UPI0033E82C7A
MSDGILGAAAVLAAALALGGVLLWRRLLRGRAAVTAYFAATVAGAVLAGTAAATPPRQTAARPDLPSGTPVLTSLTVGGKPVPVLVVPGRPGTNLVATSAADGAAGPAADRLTRGRPRPGSTLTWALVDLPPGRSTLWVSAGGATAGLPVDTSTPTAGRGAPTPSATVSGPDGPECAHHALGRALAADTDTGRADAEAGAHHAGHPAPAAPLPTEPLTTCPADALAPADAAALRTTVDHLADRGHRALALTADSSPRGRAAAAEIRAAAARAGLTVTAPGARSLPLVVATGWAGADSAVRAVASGRTRAEGTYLAPWLLTAPLLTPSAGQILPLRYAPRAPEAEGYLARLGARLPGETPTGAAYTAWRAARGTAAGPVRLYAAATVYVPGSGGGTGAHHGTTGPDWLPSGMIVPVAGPFDSPHRPPPPTRPPGAAGTRSAGPG